MNIQSISTSCVLKVSALHATYRLFYCAHYLSDIKIGKLKRCFMSCWHKDELISVLFADWAVYRYRSLSNETPLLVWLNVQLCLVFNCLKFFLMQKVWDSRVHKGKLSVDWHSYILQYRNQLLCPMLMIKVDVWLWLADWLQPQIHSFEQLPQCLLPLMYYQWWGTTLGTWNFEYVCSLQWTSCQ